MALLHIFAALIFIHVNLAQEVSMEDGYNQNTIPWKAMGVNLPQNITIDMYIDDIFRLSREGDMETRVRVVERWVDERLDFVGEGEDAAGRVEVKEGIWTP